MSSYREDTQETAIASNTTWGGLTVLATEKVHAVSVLSFGVLVLLNSAAIASDEIPAASQTWASDSAAVTDAVFDTKYATALTQNTAIARDAFINRLFVLHDDIATAGSAIPNGLLATTSDVIHAVDTVISTRYTASLFSETAKASDKTFRLAALTTQEAAITHDSVMHRARIRMVAVDAVAVTDSVVAQSQSGSALVVESTRVIDSLLATTLHAKSLVVESALAEDFFIGAPQGQAWTANTDSWAMSRYSPYTLDGLTVINGVLYGTTEDGVYALQGGTDVIDGALVFGAVDLAGNAGLVHPLSAHLEYEKTNGTAEMDVTTTQSGAAETFTYSLANEAADRLTNGRFVFGRGLRGRHFEFSLRISAEHAVLNDLLISASPTKRRV